MWGNSCNMQEIVKICKNYNLPIIEDAAEGLGSFVKINKKYKHTGTIGKVGCLSFNGNKIITTGGGGALLMNNISLFKKAMLMRDHFKIDTYNYKYSGVGYNFKLNNLSASIGNAQLNKFNSILKKKKKYFYFIRKELTKLVA
jgi:perosamine synthetase